MQEPETQPAGPVKQEPAGAGDGTPILMTPHGLLKEGSKKEAEKRTPIQTVTEPDREEFKVVPRRHGFYILEPQRPNLPRGHSMVRTGTDGVTRVYCGLCPGFTCIHVEFMKKWCLRTH